MTAIERIAQIIDPEAFYSADDWSRHCNVRLSYPPEEWESVGITNHAAMQEYRQLIQPLSPLTPAQLPLLRPQGEKMALEGKAKWKCTLEHGPLWYIELDERAKPPYLIQRKVTAILDIDANGRLAGVELIDNMPEPPLPRLIKGSATTGGE